MLFYWRLGYKIRKLECNGVVLSALLGILSLTDVNLLISQVAYILIKEYECLSSDCLAFLDIAAQYKVPQVRIVYGNFEFDERTSFSFEKVRQIYDRYHRQFQDFSLSVEVAAQGLVELLAHCELNHFQTIRFWTWAFDQDPDYNLSDNLIERLGIFRGEMVFERCFDQESVYYWSNLFLRNCPNMQSLKLEPKQYDARWRELLQHPKVVVEEWLLHKFDQEEYPAAELQSMVDFLRGALMNKLRFDSCIFSDDNIAQSIIAAKCNTLTALYFNQIAGVTTAFYRSILQFGFPQLEKLSVYLLKDQETSLGDILENTAALPALKRNLKELRLYNNHRVDISEGTRLRDATCIINYLQGFRWLTTLDINLVVFTRQELNQIFKSCPILQSFSLGDSYHYHSQSTVPVIDDFPEGFGNSITTCHFSYPTYSVAFVMKLFRVPSLKRAGKRPFFTVNIADPNNPVWNVVRSVQMILKGGKCVSLQGKVDSANNDDGYDAHDVEEEVDNNSVVEEED